MRGITCPKCGAWCASGDAFCAECGASMAATPRQGVTEEREPAEPWGPLIWFLELFPGLLSPLVLVLSAAAIVVSAGILWLALLIMGLGGFISCFFIGAIGVIVYWSAVSWLLYGYLASPTEALSEFENKHWIAFFLLTAIPVSIFFYLAKGAMAG